MYGLQDWGLYSEILRRLLIAAACGIAIGWERDLHGRSAGLRTHMLVALGSAMFTQLSLITAICPLPFVGSENVHGDVCRIAAQIVSGIGFLGAGTILQTGTGIKGLTTATTIWIVMAIGIACGSGNFVIAALGTALAFVALVMMRKIEETIAKRNPILVLLFPSDKAVLADLLSIAANHNIKIMATESFLVDHEGEKAIQITIRLKHTPDNSVSLFVDDIRVSLKPLDLKYTINN